MLTWGLLALALQFPGVSEAPEPTDEHTLDVILKALMSTSNQFHVGFEARWTPPQASEPALELKFQAKVPYYLFHQENLLRMTVPYEVGLASQKGHTGTVELVDLVIFSREWGRWGVGPVVFLPQDTPQAGPAAGVSWRRGMVTAGAFVQALFNAHAAQAIFQPSFGVALAPWFSLSLGDPKQIYDFNSGQFTALRLSLEADALLKPWGQHIRCTLKPEYDFADPAAGHRWTVTFGLQFVLPTQG
jgi:hypothetical protein